MSSLPRQYHLILVSWALWFNVYNLFQPKVPIKRLHNPTCISSQIYPFEPFSYKVWPSSVISSVFSQLFGGRLCSVWALRLRWERQVPKRTVLVIPGQWNPSNNDSATQCSCVQRTPWSLSKRPQAPAAFKCSYQLVKIPTAKRYSQNPDNNTPEVERVTYIWTTWRRPYCPTLCYG